MNDADQIPDMGPLSMNIDTVLRLLMPNGTSDEDIPEWDSLPDLPNVFGVASYLIKIAGISIYIDPHAMHRDPHNPMAKEYFSPEPEFYNELDKKHRKIRKIIRPIKKLIHEIEEIDYRYKEGILSPDDEEYKLRDKKLDDLLRSLNRANTKIEAFLSPLWQELLLHRDMMINRRVPGELETIESKELPWWDCCLKLLIASDTLCEGIGFPINFTGETDLPSLPAFEYIFNLEQGIDQCGNYAEATRSLASRISPDVAVVLPKSVTPGVGCTVRSLSHNLALLPPTGQTGAQWIYAPHSLESDRLPLNMLVIPIPYFFHASVFKNEETCEEHGWGFFSVYPKWLEGVSEQSFVKFVRDLCHESAKKAGKVDAIVFPEMAISEKLYNALINEIANATKTSVFREMEFIVSGLNDKGGVKGNFVGCTLFSGSDVPRQTFNMVRSKHHRWKIESEQIDTYRLSHVLNRSLNWWEQLPPREREIHILRFRNTSSFAALICEDLARIDPCQEVLRSVGPDLIISILMDSAQISERWPARYATVLAEDPGSSVLTITSQALIHRAKQRILATRKNVDADSLSTSIGLWKDASTWAGTAIEMPKGYSAVLLTLANKKRNMRTLDGRMPRIVPKWSWQLTDQRPIKMPDSNSDLYPTFGLDADTVNHEDL